VLGNFRKHLISLAPLLFILAFSYCYRAEASQLLLRLLGRQPCQKPITYSIASLDPRFDLTKNEVVASLKQAEQVWEKPFGKNLFEYSATSTLKISFVYDERQKATDALKKMGIIIGDDRATYNRVKLKYDSLIASYDQDKIKIEALVSSYQTAQNAYEQAVVYWNNQGGAPTDQYQKLEQARLGLNRKASLIRRSENSFNNLVSQIKSTELVLNKLVATLNLHVKDYNLVGSSTGKIFNEGEYVSNSSGTTISIFQFNDQEQLKRVLAHEFGHALGLDHIANPKAIMYYLNEEGGSGNLTTEDLAALRNICGIVR
jgi:hypothetical protein